VKRGTSNFVLIDTDELPSQHTQTVPARVPYVIPHGALAVFPAGTRRFLSAGCSLCRRDNPSEFRTVAVRVPAKEN